MSFKTTAAPCALLIAAIAAPALAQTPLADPQEVTVESIIVTGLRNPDDPPIVAEARARLSRTPGAVSVVAAETYEDRFAQGNWSKAETGAPILVDALAWLDCRIHARYPAGSHTIYVGLIEASSVPQPEAPPLVYWNRGYRKLRLHEDLKP